MAESFCNGEHVGLVLTMDEAVYLQLLLGQLMGERALGTEIFYAISPHTKSILAPIADTYCAGGTSDIGEYVFSTAPRASGKLWDTFGKEE